MKRSLDYAVSGVNSHFDLVESMNIIGGIIADTKQELQIIVDNQWFQLVNDNPSIVANIRKLKLQDISVKSIIEIRKSNATSCKKLMKFSEVRHSDILKGCIIQSEKEYFFNYLYTNAPCDSNSFEQTDANREGHLRFFYCKNEYFIYQQRLLFESLWNDSISARQKITELEKEVIEGIMNHQEVANIDESSKRILIRIIESSVDQIAILIPSPEHFWNLYSSGLLKLISQTTFRDVGIRILLVSKDGLMVTQNDIRKELKKIAKELDIYTNFLSKEISQEYIAIIVDNAVLIELSKSHGEVGDDGKGSKVTSSYDSHANITTLDSSFSTSEDRISAVSTIFNSLWVRSDMDRQNRIRKTYFDIFKGFNMKNEQYRKDWKFKKSSY